MKTLFINQPVLNRKKNYSHYLFLILLFSVSHSFSQVVPAIEWQNTIGGSGSDMLFSIKQTSDDGYIIGGMSMSGISGDKTESCRGDYDYWVIKTDVSGNIQWEKTYGGSSYDYLSSVIQVNDGGYLIGGRSVSNISGEKSEDNKGSDDFWILKTDSLGAIEWQRTIGGDSLDELDFFQQTPDNGYILSGISVSGLSGDKTDSCKGSFDYWIVKLDSIGIIQWQKTIGGNNGDYYCLLQPTTDGGYIIGGNSNSDISGDKTENCWGSVDYWILKLDSAGNIQWQNTIGGIGDDQPKSICQTFDGGYLIGGWSISNISGDKTENTTNGNDYDYWIVKTDSAGNILWQNTIGGISYDELNCVRQTPDSGFILAGSSISNMSGDKTENTIASYDYWIVKTDLLGNIQWQQTIGGNSHDDLHMIELTRDSGIILAGYSNSNLSGDKTEGSASMDYWIVKLTDKYNSITGKLFIDSNSSGVQDSGESAVQNKMVMEFISGRFGFSDESGKYQVAVIDTGNFSVSPQTINYYNCVPAMQNAFFSTLPQIDSLNYFAFQPAGIINDLCVSITSLNRFRRGFNGDYEIDYINVGTTTINPTVILFPDSNVTFLSSTPPASSITADSIVWNFGPLAPFQSGSILVTINIHSTIPAGMNVNSSVRIEPLAADTNPFCNYATKQNPVDSSYDPNEILVDEDTLYTYQFPNPPYLDYVINFQNTGTDTAFNIKILNMIDTAHLQLSTFEFLSSSLPVSLQYNSWERNMQFKFENILLPDSNVDEPRSHGFVHYRIQPKSNLISGDVISSYAAIYFDFNMAIMTNTASTAILLPTAITNIQLESDFQIYPNPVNESLMIKPTFADSKSFTVEIVDLLGKVVLSKKQEGRDSGCMVNVSKLSPGVYIVRVVQGSTVFRSEFVKY